MDQKQMITNIASFRALTAGLDRRFFAKATKDAGQVVQGDIFLYDAVGADMFGGITAQNVVDSLTQLSKEGATCLNVYINSPGGDVFDGVAIYNAIKRFKGEKTVVVDGLCASIASVIAMAGDRIATAENAMWMIHDPYGFAMGNAADMRKTADMLDQVQGVILNTYASRTRGVPEDIKNWMANETWMSAEEAVGRGFADEVISNKKKDDTSGGTDPAEPDEDDVKPGKKKAQVVHPLLAKFRKVPKGLGTVSADGLIANMNRRLEISRAQASLEAAQRLPGQPVRRIK